MTTDERQATIDQMDDALREKSLEDFAAFLAVVTIPSASGPRRLSCCIADFQQVFFDDIAPTLHAVRDGMMPPKRRFWMERTKKASKDADLALCLVWLMAFATRPLLVQVCAAKKEQAAIIKRRIGAVLFHNPWLRSRIRVVLNKVYGQNGAEVVIEATDTAGGAQGETPDMLILNELVHVAKWAVMETHMNNADGVPQGVVAVATNAGFKGTPAEKWKKDAEADPKRWCVHLWKGRAPWIDQADMDAAKKRNKGSEYERLWLGLWVSGRGDAVQEVMIDRCFDNDLRQIVVPEDGWRYVAGLDLGVSNDHSGLVVLGANQELNKIRLAWMRDWKADMKTSEGKLEVDLQDVEDQIRLMTKAFSLEYVGYDPSQAKLMAQRLQKQKVPMREMTFTGNNLTLMADTFIQVLNNGILECYDNEDGALRRDFGKFNIVERVGGMRLEATRDEWGHADVGTGLVIALPKAVEVLGGLESCLQPDDELAWSGDVELEEEEVETMSAGLREIYEMDYTAVWGPDKRKPRRDY